MDRQDDDDGFESVQKPCKFFASAKGCKFGAECKFPHTSPAAPKPSSGSFNPNATQFTPASAAKPKAAAIDPQEAQKLAYQQQMALYSQGKSKTEEERKQQQALQMRGAPTTAAPPKQAAAPTAQLAKGPAGAAGQPFGDVLARRVAKKLQSGEPCRLTRKDYCGDALSFRADDDDDSVDASGYIWEIDCWDGRPGKPHKTFAPHKENDFVKWLSQQTDASMDHKKDGNPMRITKVRLTKFVENQGT